MFHAWPKQEEYLACSRSNQIRDICLEMLRSIRILFSQRVAVEKRNDLLIGLGMWDLQLELLGISADIQQGFCLAEHSDPMLVAEYCAAQLRYSLIRSGFSTYYLTFIICQSSEKLEERKHMIKGHDMVDHLIDFAILADGEETLLHFLDASLMDILLD